MQEVLLINKDLLKLATQRSFVMDDEISPARVDDSSVLKLYFRQIVNGVPVQHSYMYLAYGKVTRIAIFAINPNALDFQNRTWAPTESLASIGYQVALKQTPNLALPDKINGYYEIRYIDELSKFRPVCVYQIVETDYAIDAVTGTILDMIRFSAESSASANLTVRSHSHHAVDCAITIV